MSIFGCTVSAGTSSDSILDPCNCTTYYKVTTNPRPSKLLQTCPTGELWNYHVSACESLETVVRSGACNRIVPWNRCDEASGPTKNSFRTNMKSKCIDTGRYNVDVANTIQDSIPGAFILSNQSQNANLELAATSFIAGCVITLIIVAMVLTMCGLPTIRLPEKLSKMMKTKYVTRKKKRTKLSKKTTKAGQPPNVTEGDNLSVMYEDIDEDDSQIPEAMGPNSNRHAQTTRVQITTTTKTKTTIPKHGNPSTSAMGKLSLQPPKRSPPVPQEFKTDTRLAPRPPGSTPKPPPRPVQSSNNQRQKVALSPPQKLNASQQPSFGYIHPN